MFQETAAEQARAAAAALGLSRGLSRAASALSAAAAADPFLEAERSRASQAVSASAGGLPLRPLQPGNGCSARQWCYTSSSGRRVNGGGTAAWQATHRRLLANGYDWRVAVHSQTNDVIVSSFPVPHFCSISCPFNSCTCSSLPACLLSAAPSMPTSVALQLHIHCSTRSNPPCPACCSTPLSNHSGQTHKTLYNSHALLHSHTSSLAHLQTCKAPPCALLHIQRAETGVWVVCGGHYCLPPSVAPGCCCWPSCRARSTITGSPPASAVSILHQARVTGQFPGMYC